MTDLTPRERARCPHPERKMSPSGTYSLCPMCLVEHFMRKVVRVPDGSEQVGLKLYFRKSLTLEEVGSLWAGFAQFGIDHLFFEEGGKALTVRATERPDEDAALVEAAEWFHMCGWK